MPDLQTASVAVSTTRDEPWRRYLNLVFYKTYADLKAESQRTYAGFAWWVVEPLLSMATYYFVFQVLLDRGTEHFALFLMAGLVPWRWLATSIQQAANSIVHARSLIQQVYLPKVILPLSAIFNNTFKFLVVLTALASLLPFFGFRPTISHLALPLIVVVQSCLIVALGFFAAAGVSFLPDLRVILTNFLRLWFFVSGVFFSVDRLPDRLRALLEFNPMVGIIRAYRTVLLEGTWPRFGPLLVTGVVSIVGIGVSAWVIRRLDYQFPKLS